MSEIHIAGFNFLDEEMGLQAEKEMKAIKFINKKINKSDIESMLKLYDSAIEQDMFKTVLGIEYLSELRDYIVASGDVPEDEVQDVPVKTAIKTVEIEKTVEVPVNNKGKETAKKTEKPKLTKEEKAAERHYKKLFSYARIIIIVLLAVIAVMIYIASTSNSPTIINYETELVNKYSAWEQELSEREEAVSEKEQKVNNDADMLLNQTMQYANGAGDTNSDGETDAETDGETDTESDLEVSE